MSDTKEHLEKRRNYWMNECGKLEVRITALESTISDHEEDSAALPEDMSITETIKMKDKYIAVLTLALEMACAFEENYNYKMCLPEKPDYPQHYIQQATAELEKEATDER